jgi:hypothetical protein
VRWLDGLMAAIFVLAVVVQYNDPDPLYWMALYLPAALLSGLAFLGHFRPRPTLLAAAVYLALALYWAPAFGQARPESFSAWQMGTVADEEVREAAGIALCALWTAVLAWRTRRGGVPAGAARSG